MAKLAATAGLEPVSDCKFAHRQVLEERRAKLSKLNSGANTVFQKVLSALSHHHCSLFNSKVLMPSGTLHSQSKKYGCSKVQVAEQGRRKASMGEQGAGEWGIRGIIHQCLILIFKR